MDALHVCGEAGYDAFAGTAGGCITLAGFDANDKFDYSGALGRALDAGISVLLYYGKNGSRQFPSRPNPTPPYPRPSPHLGTHHE